MNDKIIQLYNTLSLIKTEGQNSILMANCLVALQQIIEKQNGGDTNDTEQV